MYRMHLYHYKQRMWQCEILLAPTGSIQVLKIVPPSLTSSVEPTVSPTPCSTSQVPSNVLEKWIGPQQPNGMLLK